MTVLMVNRMLHSLLSLGHHAIRVTFTDGILCAVCGGLYGIVISGFGAQARNELTVTGVFVVGGFGAMIGFAVGAVVGICQNVARWRNLRQRMREMAARAVAVTPGVRPLCCSEATADVLRNPRSGAAFNSKPKVTLIGR